MRRISRAVVAAAVSASVVGATAVGASATGSAGPRPVPSMSGPPSPQPAPSTQRWFPPCRSSQLRPAIVGGEGAAGSTYVTLSYTNIGRHRCVVKGYPHVVFVNARGSRIGAPAAWMAGTVKPVTLAPGGKAKFVVREVHAGIPAGCDTAKTYTPAAGLRISPPTGGWPRFVKLADNACINPKVQQLYVGPITS
ncbi:MULTISPECIES: DUF4232 domain-containing protein [unclassified Pseudofrankia]|uniref:DUF4232 domain-containing protein n=1 Tax=unclassified Pseudofrankia TaxID=2994372 RepID=UPI0008D8FF70|nr:MULTISPECIES: DUF4232 domain-containing protein [unclassified Pseudofrankia]MDT3440546.1 DUF4232 domain-containing protein [Pseudofrankia sp. BMG5.37]OHV47503.1 hypothetical protein BCD48_17700 [Pseudofrankia sp. BMG5.36]